MQRRDVGQVLAYVVLAIGLAVDGWTTIGAAVDYAPSKGLMVAVGVVGVVVQGLQASLPAIRRTWWEE
ncbi:MAG: hypothetical protein U0821_18660 [Chloroflexota bacterium]